MHETRRLEALVEAMDALSATTRRIADSIGGEVASFDGWVGQARDAFDAAVDEAVGHLHDVADQLAALRRRAQEDLDARRAALRTNP